MASNLKCINEIVAEMIEELGQNDQRIRPILLQWIFEAQTEIGATQLQNKETQWLPIQDYKLKKPFEFLYPRQIQIRSDEKHCVTPRLLARQQCCPCENFDVLGCDYTITDYNSYYGLSTNAKEFTEYRILYVALPLDEDNLPMIELSCVKAVKQYALYKFLQRQRRLFTDQVPMSEIDYNLRLWQKYKDQAWARQMFPDDSSLPTIARAAWWSGFTIQDMSNGLRGFYQANGYTLR